MSKKETRTVARRSNEKRKRVPHALAVRFDTSLHRLIIQLSNGIELALDPGITPGLENASVAQLLDAEIWAAGWEIYFPKLDEGVYIPNLIEGLISAGSWLERRTKADRKLLSEQKTPVAA